MIKNKAETPNSSKTASKITGLKNKEKITYDDLNILGNFLKDHARDHIYKLKGPQDVRINGRWRRVVKTIDAKLIDNNTKNPIGSMYGSFNLDLPVHFISKSETRLDGNIETFASRYRLSQPVGKSLKQEGKSTTSKSAK